MGNPVDVVSAIETERATDFSLPTLGPTVDFTRTYRTRFPYNTRWGFGWTHSYDLRLRALSDGSLVLLDGKCEKHYFKGSAGVYTSVTAPGEKVVANLDGTHTRTLPSGQQQTFASGGHLIAVADRNGNALTFEYEAGGEQSISGVSPNFVTQTTGIVSRDVKLLSITDPVGRKIVFSYHADGRLSQVADWAGRIWSYQFDAQNNLTQVTDPLGQVTKYEYDSDHRLTKLIGPDGLTKTENTYDSEGRVATQSFAGQTLAFSYDPVNRKTVVTDQDGRATTYFYDEYGRLTSTTDPAGYITTRVSNLAGQPVSRTDGMGVTTEWAYDAVGNLLTKTESSGTPLARTTTYTYNAGNQVTSITVKSVVNPLQNKQTLFGYDPKGNMTKRTETGLLGDGSPYSYVTTYTYTANGQIASIDGPRTDASDVTAFSYDSQGRLLSVTQPGSLTTAYSNYTQTGRPQSVTDPNGVATTYTYDSLDRVKTVAIAGDTTAYAYTPSGKISSITLPKGNAITYSYDTLDRLSQIKDALGNSIDYTYDSAGNRTKEEIKDATGALQKTLSFQHDALNRLARVVNPDASYTEYGYDGRGNRVSLRTPNSQLTTYQYDSLNRLISVIQPPPGGAGGSVTTSYAYTTQDGLAGVTDGNGSVTTYNYDDMGRVYRVTSPDTGTTTYQYDPAGNLVQKTDAKGVTTGYQYDALNRLTKIDFPADGDVVYAYDSCLNGKGRLCGTTDQAGTASYQYSPKGELVQETKVIQGRTYVTSYQFDKNGNLSTITYPSGRTVSYALDAADRTTAVTTTPPGGTSQTVASSISHKPFGGIASMTYANGLARSVGYDQQYRINSIVTGAVQNLAYTHDPNGNITKITDAINPTKNKTFNYDALDRLTGATGPWGSLSWTYDPVGNRQTQVENGATSTYSYQSGTNKLSGVAGASPLSFTLDSNGNTTTESTKTFTYNQNNRLIKASESGATKGEYTFNANGQRATKTAGGSTTVYHHDQQGSLIAETTSAGALIAEYVWLEGQPVAKVDSGGTRYIHPDHLGTPQIMTSSTGAKVWEIEAKPFGDGASITGSAVMNLRFPGQYYDSETGLHQNWHRDYMPGVGRYAEADPILGFETQLVRHIRRQERRVGGAAGLLVQQAFSYQVLRMARVYMYASNGPYRRIDPEGLSDLCVEKCHVILSVPLCGPPVIAAGCFRIPVAVLCRQMLETICQLHCHEDKRPDPDDWDNAVNPDDN